MGSEGDRLKMNLDHSDRLCEISVSLQGIEREADCKSREDWYEGRWWENATS